MLSPSQWQSATDRLHASSESYPPRVVIMLVLFVVSLAAVAFPEVSRRSKYLNIPRIVFFVGRHFGTGVILSTAFSHLLQDAFESLQNPIVKEHYNNIGKWTGLIMLSSLLLIFLIEYISSTYVERLYDEPSPSPTPNPTTSPKQNSQTLQDFQATCPGPESTSSHVHPHETTPLLHANGHLVSSRSHPSIPQLIPTTLKDIVNLNHPRMTPNREHIDLPEHNEYFGLDRGCAFVANGGKLCRSCSINVPGSPMSPCEGTQVLDEEANGTHRHPEPHHPSIGRRRQIVGLLVLQLGIMIHSMAIGLTLAVISGADFASLTTAIMFHQIFEGLSLGIRICTLPPPPGHPRGSTSWLTIALALLFAVTTPCGMAIGLTAFGRRSEAEPAKMILIQGLLSAISASMLIYAATVEMLAGDFIFGSLQGPHSHSAGHGNAHGLEDSEEKDEVGPAKQATAILSLLFGVVGMQLVGLGE